MKLKLLSVLLVQFSIFCFAQDARFDLFENQTTTSILYDRVVPISKAVQPKTENIQNLYYRQVFSEISRSDFQHRLPKVDFLKKQSELGFSQGIIPLSILISDFENIRETAYVDGKISQNSTGKFVMNSNPEQVFEKHQLNLIGALLSRTETNQPTFVLKNNLIFNTSQRVISKIEVLKNGNWTQVFAEIPFQIQFHQNGLQPIKFRISFENGEIIEQSIEIQVRNKNLVSTSKPSGSFDEDEIQIIESTIPFQGYGETEAFLAQGEYQIYLDTVDGILDRPVILIDGFDPGDSRGIDDMYHILDLETSGNNLADVIRAEGYDVVLLNFPVYTRPGTSDVIDGGADYIQRNAMILTELINQLNQQKVGDHKNVVIGPSMGGLISRYALRYMEMNGLEHDTRLYISFDSPHLGANVPIGIQHLFNYMAYGPFGDVSVQQIVDGMLKSPAAREMLIDHFESHLQAGSNVEFDNNLVLPDGSPGFRDAFQNELNTMGFPEETRNVAVINGAGNGTTNGSPGMTVIDHIFNITSTQRAIIALHFTPSANQTQEVSHFQGQQWIVIWLTIYESLANSKSPAYTDGLDSAPGGRFDMAGLAESIPPNDIITEFLDNLQIEYFSFIPALSAMAITETQNLYSPVESGLNTPFVNFYIPGENQIHVTLNQGNGQFVLDEILIGEMSTEDPMVSGIWIENPVKNMLRIQTNEEWKDAQIKIIDLSGKIVFVKKDLNLNGMNEIPVKLPKGNYVIQIISGKKQIFKKIIKS